MAGEDLLHHAYALLLIRQARKRCDDRVDPMRGRVGKRVEGYAGAEHGITRAGRRGEQDVVTRAQERLGECEQRTDVAGARV